jgi:hypothetical protein
MKHAHFPIALVAISLGLSCSVGVEKALTERAVSVFHNQYNIEDYENIFDHASDSIKNKTSKDNFVNLLARIHAKLGNTIDSKETSYNFNYGTGGKVVTLIFDSTFAHGKGTEKFVYRIINNQAILSGYWLNSNDLLGG